MAVSYDNSTSVGITGTATGTGAQTLTVASGSNNFVIVSLLMYFNADSGASLPACTINSTSAPLIAGTDSLGTIGSGFPRSLLFGLHIGSASGSIGWSITWTTGSQAVAGASSFLGVDSSAPTANGQQSGAGSSGTATLSISAGSGDMGYAASSCLNHNSLSAASQTQVFNTNNGDFRNTGAAQYALGDGTSKTYSWTAGSNWAISGCEILAAAAGGGVNLRTLALTGAGQ